MLRALYSQEMRMIIANSYEEEFTKFRERHWIMHEIHKAAWKGLSQVGCIPKSALDLIAFNGMTVQKVLEKEGFNIELEEHIGLEGQMYRIVW